MNLSETNAAHGSGVVTVVSSTYTESAKEVDGRRWVRERHTLSDGRVLPFEWLGDQDAAAVVAERAALIAKQLADEAAATEVVHGTRVPLLKPQWRRLFTRDERERIDEFELTFESDSNLTDAQRRSIRTYFKDYAERHDVLLDDPDIVAMVQIFVTVGLIGPERAAEVLAYG